MRYTISAIFCFTGLTLASASAQSPPQAVPPQTQTLINQNSPEFDDYLTRYSAHYIVPGLGDLPAEKKNNYDFTHELDENGRPKWFDGWNGVRLLSSLAYRLFNNQQFLDLDQYIKEETEKAPRQRMAARNWTQFTAASKNKCCARQTGTLRGRLCKNGVPPTRDRRLPLF